MHFREPLINVIILANQVSGLFDQKYFKKEYTCTILIFFLSRLYGNKETSRKSIDVKLDNSQGMQKMTEKWEEPSF